MSGAIRDFCALYSGFFFGLAFAMWRVEAHSGWIALALLHAVPVGAMLFSKSRQGAR